MGYKEIFLKKQLIATQANQEYLMQYGLTKIHFLFKNENIH